MRVLLYVALICVFGAAHCSVLFSPQIITASQRVGGGFAYSTVESRVTPSITYATAPLAVAQPLQSIFGPPFFNPVISSPFYPGIVGQAPVFGQGPIFGQIPAQTPVAPPPQSVPQGPAPPPPGAVVDDDTVSVESA